MGFILGKCPECDKEIPIPDDLPSLSCMYCGSTIDNLKTVHAKTVVDVSNLIDLARIASSSGNYAEAYTYYSKALELYPKNVEAWLGKAEAAGWQSNLKDLRLAESIEYFKRAIECAAPDRVGDIQKQAAIIINNIAIAIFEISKKHTLEFVALDGTWVEHLEKCRLVIAALEIAYSFDADNKMLPKNIIEVCRNNVIGISYKDPFDNNIAKAVFVSDGYDQELRDKIGKYEKNIQRLEPNYSASEAPRAKPDACFIATACMGSSSHLIVRRLQFFKHNVLLRSDMGSAFVDIYYGFGSPLARILEKSRFLRTLTKVTVVIPLYCFSSLVLKSMFGLRLEEKSNE